MSKDINAVYDLFRERVLATKLLFKSGFVSEELVSGSFKSIYYGRGLQRAESILYYPGADISRIDINSTIRSGLLYFNNKRVDFIQSLYLGKVYLKQEEEEKDKNMFLIIDANKSMTSRMVRERKEKTKLFQTLFSIYLFSLIGIKSGFGVGGFFIDNDILFYVSSNKNETIPSRLVDKYINILKTSGENKEKYFDGVLRKIYSMLSKPSMLVFVSDFQFMDNFMNTMQFIKRKHQVVPIIINDKKEFWERIPEKKYGEKIPKIQLYGYRILKQKKSKKQIPSKEKWLEQIKNELFINRMFPLVFDAEDDNNVKMQKMEEYFKQLREV